MNKERNTKKKTKEKKMNLQEKIKNKKRINNCEGYTVHLTLYIAK